MQLKCYTQYAIKFGKVSSGHRTGKGQFSFQSQRRAMPKNIQTTVQLPSSHMLPRSCSTSFKLGFKNMWTENSQMYKLDLEKAEEPETKLSTSTRSEKKQENFRKTSTSASLTMLKPLTVWITTNCGNFLEMGIPDQPICFLRNLYAGQEATGRTGHGTMDWFKLGKEYVKAVYCHPACLTFMQNTSCKMPGWMTH